MDRESLEVDRESLDVDRCAQEPIHIPGAIQPHGCLLAFNPQTLVVSQASANAADFFGATAAGLPADMRRLRRAFSLA